MPSKSSSQHNLMLAVAHNPAFAKKVGISQKVGKEFTKADENKKMKGGGLYENINAKRERIAEGSGEKMRRAGSKGAPSAKDFKESAKTAKVK
jgi:phage-related baseplate assembly protein